jgi:nucleoside-triphosphatase THEP1
LNNDNIYILSRPVRSGKTTMLQEWTKTKEGVLGLLTPEVNGMRKLHDLSNGRQYDLQLGEEDREKAVAVGRFLFDPLVFRHSHNILYKALDSNPEWLVVDEIGKLEIEHNTGLEPMISGIIKIYKNDPDRGKLLLVIRDYLVFQAIYHYKIKNPHVIDSLNEL